MASGTGKWRIVSNQAVFEEARKDERFRYIVALARAMNAINFAHAPFVRAAEDATMEGQRDRLNSSFLRPRCFTK